MKGKCEPHWRIWGVVLLSLALTPGAIRPLSRASVCSIRWGADRRHVTVAMRRETMRRYGIRTMVARGKGPCCELDHLIPRELAGADSVDNLWPQPWADAVTKDREENRLHRAVCTGQIPLREAQERMRAWPH